MRQPIYNDADRLEAIRKLEQLVSDKQPSLSTARSSRDAAKKLYLDRQKALAAVDGEITHIANEVYRKGNAVFLNGKSLQQFALILGKRAKTAMPEVAECVVPSDRIECVSSRSFQGFLCPSCHLAQVHLDLGECELDRRQIRRVSWEEPHLAPSFRDQPQDRVGFVGTQVVHQHDLPRVQARTEHLPHIGDARVGVQRPLQGHRRLDAPGRQRRHQGRARPLVARHAAAGPLPPRCTRIAAGHRGGGPRLIDHDDLLRVKRDNFLQPRGPRDGILLTCRNGLS